MTHSTGLLTAGGGGGVVEVLAAVETMEVTTDDNLRKLYNRLCAPKIIPHNRCRPST